MILSRNDSPLHGKLQLPLAAVVRFDAPKSWVIRIDAKIAIIIFCVLTEEQAQPRLINIVAVDLQFASLQMTG